MTNEEELERGLIEVLELYQKKFASKEIANEETYQDILMELFGITYIEKFKNMQYWGRELGKCWERIVQKVFKSTNQDYKPGIMVGRDEICDCTLGKLAIDAKYRVGSGDSGTLKKFKAYGGLLKSKGYIPVMLFLRKDNLSNALVAIKTGGWEVYVGDKSFEFILKNSGFDVKNWLIRNKDKFKYTK